MNTFGKVVVYSLAAYGSVCLARVIYNYVAKDEKGESQVHRDVQERAEKIEKEREEKKTEVIEADEISVEVFGNYSQSVNEEKQLRKKFTVITSDSIESIDNTASNVSNILDSNEDLIMEAMKIADGGDGEDVLDEDTEVDGREKEQGEQLDENLEELARNSELDESNGEAISKKDEESHSLGSKSKDNPVSGVADATFPKGSGKQSFPNSDKEIGGGSGSQKRGGSTAGTSRSKANKKV